MAYPMHGQHKLSNEGYRTRDGHIIEWLGRSAAQSHRQVAVVSRPEPVVLASRRRIRGRIAEGSHPIQTFTWRVPSLDAKHWWVRSAGAYPKVALGQRTPAVIWNPLAASAPVERNPFKTDRPVVLDLLDDWTIHHGFVSIRSEIEAAYRRAFESSSTVFANSEGTLELAHRYGRTDAVLMPNGVDPERFQQHSTASGPITVGYVGKIGNRLDARLIENTCTRLPKIRFVFAGQILDAKGRFRRLLTSLPNVEWLGDVQYEDVPDLMATFDVGWVPHSVGVGEVGGDAIKIYEYRASGLPVLTTPIIGAGRVLKNGVFVLRAQDHPSWIADTVGTLERVPRIVETIPPVLTWREKASTVARALGVEFTV
ncbi:hypothetical protein BST17_03130 [Mycolicibacterium bacteremicum]|uniref:Glycosyl transferase family 1 n=1 Tax=Mycolicibacterium bacteremicum TaxID=564198 RepID=A0A1W9Z3F4_MYCBA|nr:hypothetical protein BST17_03130 [Mycolicibacterium bacteremicum]